jgi:signal transduction histidine kinase/CheY-like chemotaxis protein
MAVVVLLWAIEPLVKLVSWFSILVLALVVRIILTKYYLHLNPSPNQWRRWAIVSIILTTLFGLIWGTSSFLFLDLNEPVSVIVIVTLIVALNSGAASSLASNPPSFYAFAATTFVPTIWILITSGTTTGIALAVLTLVGTLVVTPLICQNIHRVLKRSLRIGFENEVLRLEAERANAAKTRFLAAASHDLRQPIHALGLSFATLADKVRNAERQALIDQVENSITAVDNMLRALLDISKLDAGVVSPNLEPVPAAPLFRQLHSEFLPMTQQQGNTLIIRPTKDWAQSDPGMLERILRNLLGNALRYTSNGQVLLTARRRGDYLRFEVHDTGPGIPEDRFDDIFIEFQQLGNPHRDRRQGLGLGLAIVKRLAGLLGHPIGLTSQLGRGSCFWVETRLAQPQETAHPPPGETERLPGDQIHGARVLVLDDETSILQSMRHLLEHWGCEVSTAATLEEAHRLVQAEAQDLLIVDYRLAGEITGLNAANHLQETAGHAIPVLVITGDTAPQRLREARDSGYPLLHKPVQPARLRSTMQHLIRDRLASPSTRTI